MSDLKITGTITPETTVSGGMKRAFTTSDAMDELIQARTDANENSYSTLKDRLDTADATVEANKVNLEAENTQIKGELTALNNEVEQAKVDVDGTNHTTLSDRLNNIENTRAKKSEVYTIEEVDARYLGLDARWKIGGKNLLIVPNSVLTPSDKWNVTVSYDHDTGYTTIAGTRTGTPSNCAFCTFTPTESGTYTLSAEDGLGTGKPAMYVHEGDTLIATWKSADSSVSAELTAGIEYSIAVSTTLNKTVNYKIGLQLEKSATATGFEKVYYVTKKSESYSREESDNLYEAKKVIESKNLLSLEPQTFVVGSGTVSVAVDNNNGYVKIQGNRKGNNPLRFVLKTFTVSENNSYTFSYEDFYKTGKPAMYICEGETIVATWSASKDSVTATLSAGTTYTLEFFIPTDGSTVSYNIGLQMESGATATYYVSAYSDESIYPLSGKLMSICGVSIDTYPNYIPSGNACYYSTDSANNHYLASVDDTWWSKLLKYTGMKLLVNNSWSGARSATSNGVDSSGVHRCISLDDGTNTPDVIFVGAFALNDWNNTSIGDWDPYSANLPGISDDLSDTTVYENYKAVIDTYRGSLAAMFSRLQTKYPNAKIYALDAYNYQRANGYNPTGNSETQCIPVFNKALYEIADYFGVKVINTSKCGITATNSKDYCVETTDVALHPNALGHTLIFEQCVKDMGI